MEQTETKVVTKLATDQQDLRIFSLATETETVKDDMHALRWQRAKRSGIN